MTELTSNAEYGSWLAGLKQRIQAAQQRATLSVNRELILLYWHIGRDILERQQAQGWGAKVIDQLAKDLMTAFPDMKGFSRSNLMYMRAFHEAWPEEPIVQQLVGQLPWGQNLLLLTKLKTREERQWYATKAIEHGWSRNVMWHHISTQLQQRTGKAVTNFDQRLPSPDSELAQQTLKDPYLFDFLGVELKAGDFKPEHAGQLNFYVTVVDEKIKSDEDKPTLGLLLCKQQHRVVAEYTLRGMTQPIGIAEYKLQLPDDVAKYLPTIAQIEAELLGDDE